jgi:LPXTG-site transpeptidase (sortase) family protein
VIITHDKRRRCRIVLIGTLVGVGALAALTYIGTQYLRPVSVNVTPGAIVRPLQSKTNDVKYGLPVRLIIPKINVDAHILYMGVTAAGDMDVPADLENVGWYKYGPHPGDTGSAVIAGHLEGVKDLGVFIGLDKLQKGDDISILDDKGATTNFVVRESRAYPQKERPSEIFHSDTGAHLNLITCTGIWNNTTKRYSQRLVVFADKS